MLLMANSHVRMERTIFSPRGFCAIEKISSVFYYSVMNSVLY